MYRSILVPLDGSPMAEWALPAAIGIARQQSAQLELVTVEPVRPVAVGFDGTATDEAEPWRSSAQDAQLSYLADVVERIKAVYPVPVKHGVRAGRIGVANEIVQHAHDADTDLIVMATHGYGPFKRFWLGSVADSVIRRSRIATLLVRPRPDVRIDLKTEVQFRNILIPLDGSEAAATIIDHALALGGPQAQYTLFQALPLIPVFATEFVVVAADTDAAVRQAQEQSAQALLDTTAERLRLRDPQLQVRTATETDHSPAAAILGYADQKRCDLITLTSHGHGGAVRMMLGSVADKVVRGAEVPVLVYRPA